MAYHRRLSRAELPQPFKPAFSQPCATEYPEALHENFFEIAFLASTLRDIGVTFFLSRGLSGFGRTFGIPICACSIRIRDRLVRPPMLLS